MEKFGKSWFGQWLSVVGYFFYSTLLTAMVAFPIAVLVSEVGGSTPDSMEHAFITLFVIDCLLKSGWVLWGASISDVMPALLVIWMCELSIYLTALNGAGGLILIPMSGLLLWLIDRAK